MWLLKPTAWRNASKLLKIFEGINIFPNLVNTFLYFSDLDAFDDAKFSRVRDYISEHLSRDSCLLCLGNLICTDHIMALYFYWIIVELVRWTWTQCPLRCQTFCLPKRKVHVRSSTKVHTDCQFPDQIWVKCLWFVENMLHPIRCSTHIWVVMHHQYGISALISQLWSFLGETTSGIVKYWLFPWASFCMVCFLWKKCLLKRGKRSLIWFLSQDVL